MTITNAELMAVVVERLARSISAARLPTSWGSGRSGQHSGRSLLYSGACQMTAGGLGGGLSDGGTSWNTGLSVQGVGTVAKVCSAPTQARGVAITSSFLLAGSRWSGSPGSTPSATAKAVHDL